MADPKPVRSNAPPSKAPRFARDGELLDPPVPEVTSATLDAINPDRTDTLPHELQAAKVPIVAALHLHGYSRTRIARALKCTVASVSWCLRAARDRQLLQGGMIEAVKELDDEAVPLAVEAVLRSLKKGEASTAMKVLEGRGLLRNFSQVNQEGPRADTKLAFQFNFQLPNGGTIAPAVQAIPEALGPTGTKQIVGAEREE
jgi:hypothetical protein